MDSLSSVCGIKVEAMKHWFRFCFTIVDFCCENIVSDV